VSLWTPDGERPIKREPETPPAAADVVGEAPDFDDLSAEEQAQAAQMAAEMAEARQQIAETPASLIVANHVMGLYELAAIHLSNQPPKLGEAAVAIDAMGAVLEALPGRLGDNESVLRDAIQQLRLAYVEVSKLAGSTPSTPSSSETAAEQAADESSETAAEQPADESSEAAAEEPSDEEE
jgi:hypothetical protein